MEIATLVFREVFPSWKTKIDRLQKRWYPVAWLSEFRWDGLLLWQTNPQPGCFNTPWLHSDSYLFASTGRIYHKNGQQNMVKHVGTYASRPRILDGNPKISSLPVPWPVTKNPHRQPGFLADGCNNVRRSNSRTGRCWALMALAVRSCRFCSREMVGDFGRISQAYTCQAKQNDLGDRRWSQAKHSPNHRIWKLGYFQMGFTWDGVGFPNPKKWESPWRKVGKVPLVFESVTRILVGNK